METTTILTSSSEMKPQVCDPFLCSETTILTSSSEITNETKEDRKYATTILTSSSEIGFSDLLPVKDYKIDYHTN